MEDLVCPSHILAHNLEFIAKSLGAVKVIHAQS